MKLAIDNPSAGELRQAWWILAMNALAFTVCFAVWMMNGVLVTFLVDNGAYRWTPTEMGWLIGIPVLTGSLARLPLGLATDKWGGRVVFGLLLLLCAVPTYLLGWCDTYFQFCLASLGFGLTGASFAVGVAYTSTWFPKNRQGTALGIFGVGNIGAGLTSLCAPQLLDVLTRHGENIDAWRRLPAIYAALLVVMGVVFLMTTKNRLPAGNTRKSLAERLAPLRNLRVWRFGLYYFFLFGGFVGLAQWLLPYYVNVYGMTVAMAGAGRLQQPALGLDARDRWLDVRSLGRAAGDVSCLRRRSGLLRTARRAANGHLCAGSGVMARFAGTVAVVSPGRIVVHSPKQDDVAYEIAAQKNDPVAAEQRNAGMLVLPHSVSWQEAVVEAGQKVAKRQLLARGVTHIFFQANLWIFTGLSLLLGTVMGIGMAAVYKHIPDYFPQDVGVVGGIVGVIGGLGGFVYPVIFGYLLQATGFWTTCWMLFFLLAMLCLLVDAFRGAENG